MPKRTVISSILVIGAESTVIGQTCGSAAPDMRSIIMPKGR